MANHLQNSHWSKIIWTNYMIYVLNNHKNAQKNSKIINRDLL